MNYEFGSHIETAGTALRGYLEGYTRADLAEVFGEPETFTDPGKIDFNWNLGIEDPETGMFHKVTIYNYDGDCPGLHDEYRWHIGGHTRIASHLVHMLVEELMENQS